MSVEKEEERQHGEEREKERNRLVHLVLSRPSLDCPFHF